VLVYEVVTFTGTFNHIALLSSTSHSALAHFYLSIEEYLQVCVLRLNQCSSVVVLQVSLLGIHDSFIYFLKQRRADLTGLFDWNTKQLFVMLIAHYQTSKNVSQPSINHYSVGHMLSSCLHRTSTKSSSGTKSSRERSRL